MLGFGLGLTNCGIVGGVADAPDLGSGAAALLAGETDGLALDFTDQSARIKDTSTPANNYNSTGIVSSGALVGPGGKLTYTSPSNKLCRQADGYIKYGAHNLVSYSEAFESNAASFTSGATVSGNDISVSSADAYAYRKVADSVVAGATYKVVATVYSPVAATNVGFRFVNSYSGTGADTTLVSFSAGQTQDVTLTLVNPTASGQADFGLETRSGVIAGADDQSGKTFTITKIHCYRYPANADYIKTTTAAKYALPIEYDTSGNCEGLLVEEARTNLCLYSNDLTQAGSWTASNMTTAKTATGPDNVANSATTITASAGNATILQAITSASAARITHVFLKRRTGTGNIDLTQDNGSTWTTQAVTSTWTRFSLSSVTSANPTVGIRIVTSGDAVDVAYFQHSLGSFATSPILTYGAAATRAADNIRIATTAFPWSNSVGTLFAHVKTGIGIKNSARLAQISDGTGERYIEMYYTGGNAQTYSGGGTFFANIGGLSADQDKKMIVAISANDGAGCIAGGTVTTDNTVTVGQAATNLYIGYQGGISGNELNGHIKAISYVPRRKSDAELQAETA